MAFRAWFPFVVTVLATATNSGDESEHTWKSYDRRRYYWGEEDVPWSPECLDGECVADDYETERVDSLPNHLHDSNDDDDTTNIHVGEASYEENAQLGAGADENWVGSAGISLYPPAGGRLLWAPDPRQWQQLNLRATLAVHGLPPPGSLHGHAKGETIQPDYHHDNIGETQEEWTSGDLQPHERPGTTALTSPIEEGGLHDGRLLRQHRPLRQERAPLQPRPQDGVQDGGEGRASSSSETRYNSCMSMTTPSNGEIGQECGYLFGDKWISVNDLVDWLLQQGDVGWPSIPDLITMAATQYANFVEKEAVFMSKEDADRATRQVVNKARRWTEWRAKSMSSGPTEMRASSSTSMTTGSTSSPAFREMSGGQASSSPSPSSLPASSSTSTLGKSTMTQSVVGFYRHGEFVPRERTAEEKRRQQGGQGPQRTARRAARMEQWQQGAWLPSWLRQYQHEKAERDAHRQLQRRDGGPPDRQDAGSQGDDNSLLQLLPDPVDRAPLGDDTGSLQSMVAVNPEMDDAGDVTSFMDRGLPRAGLRAEERERLTSFGIPEARQKQLDEFLQVYENYQSIDLGAEARWALARWLQRSQLAAGLQDECEDILRTRAQTTTCFPLRREPLDVHLRHQLLEWVDQLTPLMGEVFVQGASLGTASSVLTPPTEIPPSSSSTGVTSRRQSSRSRSRSRHPGAPSAIEGDETTLMDLGDGGGTTTPTPEAVAEDDMEEEESEMGYGSDSPLPLRDDGEILTGVGFASADALRSDSDHYFDVHEEGTQHVDRIYLVEREVRRQLGEASPSTAREITRRLLMMQSTVQNIQWYLQRALELALQVCPSAPSRNLIPSGADARVSAIWDKVIGEVVDVPLVERMHQAIDHRLRRRLQALRELEGRGHAGHTDGGGDEIRGVAPRDRSPRPKARPRPLYNQHGAASGNTRPRPRPSVAPHLAAPSADPQPPCLRPWWERPLGSLHSMDPPGAGVFTEEERRTLGLASSSGLHDGSVEPHSAHLAPPLPPAPPGCGPTITPALPGQVATADAGAGPLVEGELVTGLASGLSSLGDAGDVALHGVGGATDDDEEEHAIPNENTEDAPEGDDG